MNSGSLRMKLCSRWPIAWEQLWKAFPTTRLWRKSSFPLIFLVKSFFQTQQAASAFCGELQQVPVPAGRRYCIQALMQGGHSLVQAAPTSCTYTGPHSRPNLYLACCVCLWQPQDPAFTCLLWNLGQPHSSLKMNRQQLSRFFAAPIHPMCHCKDVVGLMPLGPKAFLLQEWVKFASTK